MRPILLPPARDDGNEVFDVEEICSLERRHFENDGACASLLCERLEGFWFVRDL